MKYWVYKDTRIFGPLDKEEVAGIPGMDSATLVCAGESAAATEGDWRPAGDVADLADLSPRERASLWPVGGEFSEASGDLLRDAEMNLTFAGLPASAPASGGSDVELRRAQERVAELSSQLELLKRRIAEFEASQVDWERRLVEKKVPSLPEIPSIVLPPSSRPAVEPVPLAAEPPPQVEVAPVPESSAPVELPERLEEPEPLLNAPPSSELSEPASNIAPQAKKPIFEHKTFKAVSMAKMFRVIGPDESFTEMEVPPSPPPASPLVPAPIEQLAPAPAPAEPPTGASAVVVPSPPPPFDWGAPAPVPPATLAFGGAVPQEPSRPPFAPEPVQDFVVRGAAAPAREVPARLAKPEPTPEIVPPPPRSKKPFILTAGALVLAMAGAGFIFLRHPKDLKQMAELDDGRARVGTEPVEESPRPPSVEPPSSAPPYEAVLPASSEASKAASQASLDAAIALVKDFPLDGDRGTVAGLLQWSYSASPDAGTESWSASETGDKTFLVEYRFVPAARSAAQAHYLFEADMDRGLVLGKNLDAKSMLAGGPRGGGGTAKPAPKKKIKTRAVAGKKSGPRTKTRGKRAAAKVEPGGVPLLPLPSEGELRPPADDSGAFSPDPAL